MTFKTITKLMFSLCAMLQIHGIFCAAAEEVPADHPLVEYTSSEERNWATITMHDNEGEILFGWGGQLSRLRSELRPIRILLLTIDLQPNSEAYMEALPEDIRELVVAYQRAQWIESIKECAALPAGFLWGVCTSKLSGELDPRLKIAIKSLGGVILLGVPVYLFTEDDIPHPALVLYSLPKEKKWILGAISGFLVG